jgi:hypothetical protein
MKRTRSSAFARPVILEAVVLLTLGGVAILEVLTGMQLQCTALVEFGMLSAVAAGSAALLFVRYAVDICGFFADYAFSELWGARLSTAGYALLGLYALVNDVRDLTLPRHQADGVSYPGLILTFAAVLVLALVVQAKFRAIRELPSRSLRDSSLGDTFCVAAGALTLPVLAAHTVAPAWRRDTAADAVFVVLFINHQSRAG